MTRDEQLAHVEAVLRKTLAATRREQLTRLLLEGADPDDVDSFAELFDEYVGRAAIQLASMLAGGGESFE